MSEWSVSLAILDKWLRDLSDESVYNYEMVFLKTCPTTTTFQVTCHATEHAKLDGQGTQSYGGVFEAVILRKLAGGGQLAVVLHGQFRSARARRVRDVHVVEAEALAK